MGFLDNIFKDDKKQSNGNPLGNIFGGRQTFQGAGQSLGGSKPGKVIAIVLADNGPLGVRVEKRPNSGGTAIVNQVVPGSQAEAAGMQRGDILCYPLSNGQEDIMYDMFLEMAQSTQRPIHLEVRRISTSLDKKQQTSTPQPNNSASADTEARRKAVIAAAEAREKAHKVKSRPIKLVTKTTLARQLQQQKSLPESTKEPLSEASKQAAQAAKQSEAQVAAQLGYNPYVTSRATAGQARNATTAVQHGSLSSQSGGDHLPDVAPPRQPTVLAADEEPSVEFQQAHAAVLSANGDAKSSLTIMKKLLTNATTKGQTPGEDAAKFRKVRLANAKIRAAIVDVEGAIELMLACGFSLEEQDGESVLIYPADFPGPDWLPVALKQMEAK